MFICRRCIATWLGSWTRWPRCNYEPLALPPLIDEQPPFAPHETLSDFSPIVHFLHSLLAGVAHPVRRPAIADTITMALVCAFIGVVSVEDGWSQCNATWQYQSAPVSYYPQARYPWARSGRGWTGAPMS